MSFKPGTLARTNATDEEWYYKDYFIIPPRELVLIVSDVKSIVYVYQSGPWTPTEERWCRPWATAASLPAPAFGYAQWRPAEHSDPNKAKIEVVDVLWKNGFVDRFPISWLTMND